MENIQEKLQKIIAAYTPFKYTDIDLDAEIEDRYISAPFKDNFANDICNAWPSVNCTNVHNNMFVTLKTGNDIIHILQFVAA